MRLGAALEAVLAYLTPEDRLGRSMREMLDTAHWLQSRGVKLRCLTEAASTPRTRTSSVAIHFMLSYKECGAN